MKITIMDPLLGEEEEIIIKCSSMNESILALINALKQADNKGRVIHKLHVYHGGEIHLLEPAEVFYFEYVDQKVFAYCKTKVYEIKSKLYELEDMLQGDDFVRVSKSCILNLNKISSLAPAFGGRFEAFLKNGEKVIISRQYVNALKKALGL
ncbi:MAG: LytTR family transcriptional regulator DNA-binding domain-containing protein [Lachnospiraceae bacterium]|nr:LytTR family transcriptional regulator DNA-binding domain-containing protein [Lachnospiraceae bacterium]